MDNLKFGTFIQALRKAKGVTQADVAEYFQISPKTVSKWECGDALPEIPMLKALAEYYEVTVDELLNGEKGKVVENPKVQGEYVNYIYNKKNKQLTVFFVISVCIQFIAFFMYHILYRVIDDVYIRESVARLTYFLIAGLGLVFFGIAIYLIINSQNAYDTIQSQKLKRRRNILIYFIASFTLIFFIQVIVLTHVTVGIFVYYLILLGMLVVVMGLGFLLFQVILRKRNKNFAKKK